MSRPSFQFYPNDWMTDPALKACSDLARLLWLELICIMHNGSPYGYLTLPNGTEIEQKMIEKFSNFDQKNAKKIPKLIQELIEKGVAKKCEKTGLIYSKRMVEDERVRTVRAESGSKGGNPLLVNQNQTKTSSKQASKTQPLHLSSSSSEEITNVISEKNASELGSSKFAKDGLDIAQKSGNMNMQNFNWVKSYLDLQLKANADKNPETLLKIWAEVCARAAEKSVSHGKWYRTTFEGEVNTWTPASQNKPASVAVQHKNHKERLMAAKKIRNIFDGNDVEPSTLRMGNGLIYDRDGRVFPDEEYKVIEE